MTALLLVSCSHVDNGPQVKRHSVSENLEITAIRPGVWLHTSWHTFASGARFPANGLLILDQGELLLIDTAWGEQSTRDLLSWIDKEFSHPLDAAVVTHFHADSAGGTAVLVDAGIPVFAHPRTVGIMRSRNMVVPALIAEFTASDAVSFRHTELFYPGPGHSMDNMVVWLPMTRILFGSCAVRSPEFSGKGNVADADERHWPIAIRKVLQRYPDVNIVVPGHGPVGTKKLLQHTIDLFADH
ncbi:MAG: subclass B1 metallo-beta-lactamase [Gammaproteobacteria bacterium]|nr:subclass B1 metallo-beta-lactamase [Gammaproteobacteria bacterium]